MAEAKQKVIYTALTAGHDLIRPPAIVEPDIDYIAYTDAPESELPPPWRHRPVAALGRNPRVTARWYKILPHRHLPEYHFSFWIDANYEIIGPFSPLFDRLAASTILATQPHPIRACVYREAEQVKHGRIDHPEIVDIQMEYYRRQGYPPMNGLIESGVMFRAHMDERVRAAMEDWWDQVATFSQRDQLSANFVFWKHGLTYEPLPWTGRDSPWLRYHDHVKPVTQIATEDAV